MYKREFQTIINKPYIEIPDYEKLKGHKVKIIVLDSDSEKELDELFAKSNNKIKVTNKLATNIDEMIENGIF